LSGHFIMASCASGSAFTRHQLLLYPDILPGQRLCLPFFLHKDVGDVLFTDEAQKALEFSEDTAYEAIDHRLLWIAYDGHDEGTRERWKIEMQKPVARRGDEGLPKRVQIHYYFGRVDLTLMHLDIEVPVGHTISDDVCVQRGHSNEVPPERILVFADFFRDKEGLPSRWNCQGADAKSISLKSCPDKAGAPRPHCGPLARALYLKGSRRLTMRRPLTIEVAQRVHVRGYFFDEGSTCGKGCHWIGFTSRAASGALGVSSASPSHYSFLRVFDENKPGEGRWEGSAVARSVGWHLFELELREGELLLTVDDEPVARLDSSKHSHEELWLGAHEFSGVWGGIEVLHTPLGHDTWETGVQSITPGNRRPWRIANLDERGVWQMSTDGTMEKIADELPSEPEALPPNESAATQVAEIVAEVLEAAPDTPEQLELLEADEQLESEGEPELDLLEEDPVPLHEALPKARAKAKAKRRPKSRAGKAPPPSSGLVIECWSKIGEDKLCQLDRVMAEILFKLQEANVALPSNVGRVATCSSTEHAACYVYSFGTRRVHISTREGEGGRLTLVVRVGGGFMDFVEFAHRHGFIEHLKLGDSSSSDGTRRIHLTSVMSNGRVRLTSADSAADMQAVVRQPTEDSTIATFVDAVH